MSFCESHRCEIPNSLFRRFMCPEKYSCNVNFFVEVECPPNACGTNTVCKVVHGAPTCSCLDEFSGDPLTGCRHECESSDECGSEGRCTNFKCYPDVVPGGKYMN